MKTAAGNVIDTASERNAAAGADEIFVRLAFQATGYIAKPKQNSMNEQIPTCAGTPPGHPQGLSAQQSGR
ncbi:MAG TPA: hypothetical protein VFQ87_06410 [Bradyrhizobium sp.]|nr:hypothetical protein [Bradyrhizobium sp.]